MDLWRYGGYSPERRALTVVQSDAHCVRYSQRHGVFHVEEIARSIELIGPEHSTASNIDQLHVNADPSSLTLEFAKQHRGCMQPPSQRGSVVMSVMPSQLTRRFDRDHCNRSGANDGHPDAPPVARQSQWRLHCVEQCAQLVGCGRSLYGILLKGGEHRGVDMR